MDQREEVVRRAFDVAERAVDRGVWTNSTATAFVEGVQNGTVDEETVEAFEEAEKEGK